MRTFVVAAVALLAAGCKKEPTKDPAPAGAGSGSSAGAAVAPAPPAAADGVEIFVNDASVAKVTAAQLAAWPRLDTLVPEEARRLGTWVSIALTGTTKSEVARPSANYPDMVPVLFPGDGGAPAFGMFDPVEHGKRGKPGLRADRVRELRIKISAEGRGTDHQTSGETADPAKIVIPVHTPQGERQITGVQLLALPREPMPNHPDNKVWRLQQLLEVAGVKTFEQLVLSDAGGANLVLDRKDLDAGAVPFIKLNRQGSLRVRVLKQAGAAWQPAGELRALAQIKVAK